MATINNTTMIIPDLWTTSIPNKSPVLVIVSTVFFIITTAFFLTRLIFRWKTHQRGWDDLMAGLAYLTLVIQTSFLYASAHYGFGKHRANIATTFSAALFYFYLYQICYKMIGGFTKLNFCFLYLRIFSFKNFQRIVWINAVIIAAGSIAFTMGTVFQCVPIKRNWDRRVEGYCISNMAFWYSHAAFNTLMDIVVYLLPIPLIRTLHVQARTKAGLIAIFALGAFTIAASLVRMVMLRDSARSTNDPTWGSLNGWLWTEIEANTAVICCCLPALRSLFVQAWRLLTGKTGPETPTNSQEAKSQNQRLFQSHNREEPPQPTRSRMFGNFAQAKYSPPGSSHNLESIPKSTRAWLHGFSQPFNHKKMASNSSQSELTRAEEGNAAVVGSTAPRLDLGQIYKTMDVQVESNRNERYRHGSPEQEVSLRDILNER